MVFAVEPSSVTSSNVSSSLPQTDTGFKEVRQQIKAVLTPVPGTLESYKNDTLTSMPILVPHSECSGNEISVTGLSSWASRGT